MHKNAISRILFKRTDNDYRYLFSLEGDKRTDASIYIAHIGTVKSEGDQSEETLRHYALQASFHVNLDREGKVEKHLKRGGNIFARQKNDPSNHPMSSMLYYGRSPSSLNEYQKVNPTNSDIILNQNPKYFNDYEFLFYSNKSSLPDVLQRHRLFNIREYSILLENSSPIYFGSCIKMQRLIEIQTV